MPQLDGNLPLRSDAECDSGAAPTFIRQEPAECHQQELWHSPLLPAVSGPVGPGQVSSRGKWMDPPWVDDSTDAHLQLNNLVSSGIVQDYPPLCDVKGSYTAQYEHVGLFALPPRSGTNSITDHRAATQCERSDQPWRRLLRRTLVERDLEGKKTKSYEVCLRFWDVI